MLNLRMGLAFLTSLAFAGVSQAAIGTVDMTWDGCTGPVDKTTNVAAPHSIFLTVIGHDEAHRGYDVRLLYGNASQQVPDAWRFDENGCQTTALITLDVTSKVCPQFMQTGVGALQIKKVQFSFPHDPYPQTLMLVLLANTYSAVGTVDPATRYLLERITFDLSFAVPGSSSPGESCGGFEQSMCFKLSYASFVDPDINEKLFNRSNPALAVSFNGPSACEGAVPAQLKTWGAIKSQYRN